MYMKWGNFLLFKGMLMMLLFMYFVFYYKIILIEILLLNFMFLDIKIYLLLDWLSLSFSLIVLLISSMVVFYSDKYMEMDLSKNYFCYMILLFVFSMLLLIFSPNLIMIMLGWDGLGLVSYCLVIYYQSSNSYNSGMITVLSNRVGDVTILMSLIFLMNFGSMDMMSISEFLKICGMFILISGMTKSAQIPFSAWLPAAMAAPTPVSSLVHSSTLVTAGIYLLIRFYIIFNIKFYSNFMLLISLMTMFMAGVGANLEMDFKKIIAFSTLSQLGLIMMILSLGQMEMAFFHLILHALFKSMLFLCAGLIIHSLSSIQDIRYLGSFFSFNPLISSSIGLSSLALFGFPFVGGFYSKDLILELIYMNSNNFIIIFIIIISTMMTVLYSLRMMYYIVWKSIFFTVMNNNNTSNKMIYPIYLLSVSVIFFGNIFFWLLFSCEEFIVLSNLSKIFNLILISFSFYIFYIFFILNMKSYYMKFIFFFMSSMWFMSFLTSMIFLSIFKQLSKTNQMDLEWLEEMGPSGLINFLKSKSSSLNWIMNNLLNSLLLFFLSIMLFILTF
uniref:NADH dehydrogenase subunit 5 n=1 Tax=Ixodes rubicundus TaxID=722771 RepID=UPI00223874E2|nr:NADH dehydrogenase subunit 5 [Ixodes rubicundus]QLD97174.1 NADH dehydrogenase subunit 5 [Ixodes rubicundus]UYB78126.1 NADH dehydrogenase subunit 5 [Ixodes rubicundus]